MLVEGVYSPVLFCLFLDGLLLRFPLEDGLPGVLVDGVADRVADGVTEGVDAAELAGGEGGY